MVNVPFALHVSTDTNGLVQVHSVEPVVVKRGRRVQCSGQVLFAYGDIQSIIASLECFPCTSLEEISTLSPGMYTYSSRIVGSDPNMWISFLL